MEIRHVPVDDATLTETREVNRQLVEAYRTAPRAEHIPPAVVRAARASGRGIFAKPAADPRAEVRELDRDGGPPVAVRIITPAAPRGVYLHLHGGGWTYGTPDEYEDQLVALVDRAELAVVSVDYRLAPEHPFPAGLDDAVHAALWLIEHASAEFGTDTLMIGGDSAGANLVALTLLRLRDAHGITGVFRGANLIYGVFDLGFTPSARLAGDHTPVVNSGVFEWLAVGYTATADREARRHPSISPLYADLRDLPPALFSVGGLDPLLDDTLFMAARWDAAGNGARCDVYPESVHGFDSLPTRMAALVSDSIIEFCRSVTDPDMRATR